MYYLKHFILWFIIVTQMLGLAACTRLSHEPSCECECTEVEAHFECGGIHQYHNTEIK